MRKQSSEDDKGGGDEDDITLVCVGVLGNPIVSDKEMFHVTIALTDNSNI